MNVKMIFKQLLKIKDKQYRKLVLHHSLYQMLRPIDSSLALYFKQRKQNITEFSDSLPILFLIGIPRSGTTIIYQYLSIVLNICYTSNLWSTFPKCSPYIRPVLNISPPLEFDSFYGNGSKMKSPQEGGFIFNQWFPNIENHYYAEIDNNSENHLKNYFNSVYSTSKKPILIKNGRNSVRLNVLSHIFKTARYIWVHRPPEWLFR